MPLGESIWKENGNHIYYDEGQVSVGTNAIFDNSAFNVRKEITLLDDNNNRRVSIFNPFADIGAINIWNENDIPIVSIFEADNNSSGAIITRDINGENQITIESFQGSEYNLGTISTWRSDNLRLTYSGGNNANTGTVAVYGADGTFNATLTTDSANQNYGRLDVYGPNPATPDDWAASVFVNPNNGNGTITANMKNFRMQHPTQPDKEIWYACIEGPEAAAYLRGTATLQNGEATVPFTDDFIQVINTSRMTVIVTPLSATSKGIAVIEKGKNSFKVKELAQGQGNYDFDWEVKAVRKGFENYQPIRNKKDIPHPVQIKPQTTNK